MGKDKVSTTNGISSQMVIGGGVVGIGLLLLLDQFNVLSFGDIVQFFPLIFIGMGVWQIMQNGTRHATGPIIMIAIMTVLQLSLLDVVDGDFFWRLWPVALIVGGASMLLRQRNGADDNTLTNSVGSNSADSFDIFTMFGGTERQMTSKSFSGGSITALFGGAEVNLHNMEVEDRPAIINVFCMFGGIGITASPDTIIDSRVVAIFGGASDERRQRKMLAGEVPEVIVKGFVMFGGVGIEE